jgi:hypothetical protein
LLQVFLACILFKKPKIKAKAQKVRQSTLNAAPKYFYPELSANEPDEVAELTGIPEDQLN